MNESFQTASVFSILGLLVSYWLQRFLYPFWQPFLSRWLLRRGKVGLAMRLRFGKRRH